MGIPLVVLTGASGSGKTTLAHAVKAAHPELAAFFFDSIGVPSAEELAALGPEAWQRTTTFQWMNRVAPVVASGKAVLFEGQMRIAFIQEAIAASAIAKARILLVDCSDAIRLQRLTHDRRQPELADANMMNWARYLREEALRTGCEILDTGTLTVAESVELLRSYLA
jgi:adenylate kinase family enzyme